MKTEHIHPNIWKFTGSDKVNAYFLELKKKIFIDAGNRADKDEFEKAVSVIIDPKQVELVLFTHLHYDHTGNFDLFPNAEFYASQEEIDDFNKCAPFYPDKGLLAKLQPLPLEIEGIEAIETPGHTHGSTCLRWVQENILFTGDTYFKEGIYGRTDLANSAPKKMADSLKKISSVGAKMICPGHDY